MAKGLKALKGLQHLEPSKLKLPVNFPDQPTQFIEIEGLNYKAILKMAVMFYEEIEVFWDILRNIQLSKAKGEEISPFEILNAFMEHCPNLVDHVIIFATGSDTPEDREMLQHLPFGVQFDIIDACGQATFNAGKWVGKAIETAKRVWELAAPHLQATNASMATVQETYQEMDPSVVDRSGSPSGSLN